MRERHRPERTCVGCGATGGKDDLLRIVRSPQGDVAIDRTGRMPGRGAYLHPVTACARQALRRKALARSFRAALSEAEAARLLTELIEGLGDTG